MGDQSTESDSRSKASPHDLDQLVRQATAEMAAEYERIRQRRREDPGTAGDQGEENWAELLRGWLPAHYHVVTKGRVITSSGVAGPQVDVLVLAPAYPKGLLNKKLYLAAGVVAAFECKNTLRLGHIRQAVTNGIRIRTAMRADKAVAHDLVWGILAHSHHTGAKTKSPIESISEAMVRVDRTSVQDPRDCLDCVCVADLGTWTLLQAVFGGDESMLQSVYMGPLDEAQAEAHPQYVPDPIGRFLTGLLLRLGQSDSSLEAIGKYLHEAGLSGIGQGAPRKWNLDEIPPEARRYIW